MEETRLDYQLLFEEGAEGMLVFTVEGEVLDANAKARRIARRTLEYLRAAGRDGIFDPADLRLKLAFERLRTTGEFEGELDLLRWNGSPFPAQVSMSGLGEGLVSVVFRDATEHKRVEEGVQSINESLERKVEERTGQLEEMVSKLRESERSLRESEERFRRTFEQAAVGIAHVAPDGR